VTRNTAEFVAPDGGIHAHAQPQVHELHPMRLMVSNSAARKSRSATFIDSLVVYI
jgi:hypothetical protein